MNLDCWVVGEDIVLWMRYPESSSTVVLSDLWLFLCKTALESEGLSSVSCRPQPSPAPANLAFPLGEVFHLAAVIWKHREAIQGEVPDIHSQNGLSFPFVNLGEKFLRLKHCKSIFL